MRILNEPYPADFYLSGSFKVALAIGTFVSVFFFLFKPFGLASLPPVVQTKLYLGYGLVTCLAIFLNDAVLPRLMPKIFREKNWKIWKNILFISWMTVNIAVASYLLTRIGFRAAGFPADYTSFSYVLAATFIIAVFPTTVITLVKMNMLLRQNQKISAETNPLIHAHRETRAAAVKPARRVEILAENNRDVFRVGLDDLIYISAEENYVELFLKTQKLERRLIRSSLSRTEEQLKPFYPRLFRCHRTYMINVDKVVDVAGNAQGLKLTMEHIPTPIPVARRYVEEFRRIIAEFT